MLQIVYMLEPIKSHYHSEQIVEARQKHVCVAYTHTFSGRRTS